MKHNKKSQLLTRTTDDTGAILKSMLAPLAEKIARAREDADVVFVVHKPGGLARRALHKWGVKYEPVFGMSAFDAARAADWDVLTRKWLGEPPHSDDQIKLFLISGDGTALLTLTVRDGGVVVDKAPDLHVAADAEASTGGAAPYFMHDCAFGTGKTGILDGGHTAQLVLRPQATATAADTNSGAPLVLISNEYGVVVGRQYLEELAAGKRSPQVVQTVVGSFEQLLAAYADAINAEPIRIIFPRK